MSLEIIREEMVDIRCRGCHRFLGVGPADFRAYCDRQCADDFPAATAEGRDALIESIFWKTGKSKTALANAFGVSRQRVEQILSSRMIKNSL